MLLQAAFDAAFNNEPPPPEGTPMKMLPLRAAPPVVRKSIHVHRSDGAVRNMMLDVNLYCTTSRIDLGRIEETIVIDENNRRLRTPLGWYIVAADGRVLRGRVEKRSIYGEYVEEQQP